jgi:hypothetical protein
MSYMALLIVGSSMSEVFINSILLSLIAIRYVYSSYHSTLRNILEERISPLFTYTRMIALRTRNTIHEGRFVFSFRRICGEYCMTVIPFLTAIHIIALIPNK